MPRFCNTDVNTSDVNVTLARLAGLYLPIIAEDSIIFQQNITINKNLYSHLILWKFVSCLYRQYSTDKLIEIVTFVGIGNLQSNDKNILRGCWLTFKYSWYSIDTLKCNSLSDRNTILFLKTIFYQINFATFPYFHYFRTETPILR